MDNINIESVENLGQNFLPIQRIYDWQIVLPYSIAGISGVDISKYCQEVDFGDYKLSELSTMKYNSFKKFYAGVQEIESVTLNFLMTKDVVDYFRAWYHLMISEKGYYSPKKYYAKDMYIIFNDRTGKPVIKFRLKGTFPIAKPKIRGAYTDDDIIKFPIYLSVDSVREVQ